MEKHLVIGSSLYGEFDVSLLVTKQDALFIVYLMLQSQAYEILERSGQLRRTGRRLVSTPPIPFISTPSVHSGEPWAPAPFSSHIILLLAVGKVHTWACGDKVLWLSSSGQASYLSPKLR